MTSTSIVGRLIVRRTFALLLASLLGLSVLLSACGSSTQSGPIELVYWNFSPELVANADLYNKTHPGIHVTSLKEASNDPYYAKLQTAIDAGNAPDVALLEYQYAPQFIAKKGLVDLTKYGASDVLSQFPAWTTNQLSYNGKIYGIPQDIGPMALYYRKDVFTAAGYPNGPATWADYADAAQKIHAADANAYISTFAPATPGLFIGYIWQAGGKWFRSQTDGSWTVAVNDDASKKVANFWNDLVTKGLVKTDPDFSSAWNADLNTGTVDSWISAVWGQNVISGNAKDTSGKWAVAQLPQWTAGAKVSAAWGGSSTVVTKSSKHPKEAADFAIWLNTNADSIKTEVNGVGLYPAATAGGQIPEVLKANTFYGGQVINNVFSDAAANVDTSFQWPPNISFTVNTLTDLFSKATDNKTPYSKALDDLQTQLVNDLKSKGFTVNP